MIQTQLLYDESAAPGSDLSAQLWTSKILDHSCQVYKDRYLAPVDAGTRYLQIDKHNLQQRSNCVLIAYKQSHKKNKKIL